MEKRIEALDFELNELFAERAWHKAYGFNDSTARKYRKEFKDGKLSLEKKLMILFTVGRVGVVF